MDTLETNIWKKLSTNNFAYIWETCSIDDFADYIDWDEFSSNVNQFTSIEYVEKYRDKLNFSNFTPMFYLYRNIKHRFIDFVKEFASEIVRDAVPIEKYAYSYTFYRELSSIFPNIQCQYSMIHWNIKDIELYKNEIDWTEISKNITNLIINEKRVNRYFEIVYSEFLFEYSSFIDWEELSKNTRIAWNFWFIHTWKDKLSWKHLICNPAIYWDLECVEAFEKYISPLLVGEHFKNSFLWKYLLVKKATRNFKLYQYAISPSVISDYVYNFEVCTHEHSFKDFYNKYSKTESYIVLSDIHGNFWNADFLRKHQNLLNWNLIAKNFSIKWDCKMLQEFAPVIDIQAVLKTILEYNNTNSIEEILIQYEDYIDWELFFRNSKHCTQHFIETYCHHVSQEQFSRILTFSWSIEFIQKYIYKISWIHVSQNIVVIENDEILQQFLDYFDWNIVLAHRKKPLIDTKFYQKIIAKTTIPQEELLNSFIALNIVNEYMSQHPILKNHLKNYIL